MKYCCKNDWFDADSGKLLCAAGQEYEIQDAPSEVEPGDTDGYCDVHGCEDGTTLETTWLEVETHFDL